MIEITDRVLLPESIIAKVKSDGSGCVVTYTGLIRDNSQGKPVLSVEYRDAGENAGKVLKRIAKEARKRWQVENIAIVHRAGRLVVGEINLVIAVAAAHRSDGFAACQYVIDEFKERQPTTKVETYQDDSVSVSEMKGGNGR